MEQKKDMMGRPCILIPAFNPSGTTLLKLVQELDGYTVIVVDDGSDQNKQSIFLSLQKYNHVILLRHNQNQGKGMALKTGMNYLFNNLNNCCGVVTCDADGQHLSKDIIKIASMLENQKHAKLILGYRTFSNNIPLRSKIGNILTQSICSFLLGERIFDTQTGLRGIPYSFLKRIIKIKYNRYEFEMAMLIEFSSSIEQTQISTIYIDNNSSSHFNPAIDSLLIYFVIFKHVANSFLSAIVDYIIFIAVYFISKNILISLVIARICSMMFNFFVGKVYVFKSKCNSISGAMKYFILAGLVLLLSYIGITVLESAGISAYIGKIIVDFVLFFFAYFVQKKYIFK